VLRLYDAARCPYCARARIVLAEKGVEYETVEIDLSDRPTWLYEKNPIGKVPVLEEDSFVLPESEAIMEYLEERFPEPALLPASLEERALARFRSLRFEDDFADDYYAFRRGEEGADERLSGRLWDLTALLQGSAWLTGDEFGLADVAYLPWVVRLRDLLRFDLGPWVTVLDWLERAAERPAVQAELGVVAAL
jgi:stringent starvation protein A